MVTISGPDFDPLVEARDWIDEADAAAAELTVDQRIAFASVWASLAAVEATRQQTEAMKQSAEVARGMLDFLTRNDEEKGEDSDESDREDS
jgi:hypothetical protein